MKQLSVSAWFIKEVAEARQAVSRHRQLKLRYQGSLCQVPRIPQHLAVWLSARLPSGWAVSRGTAGRPSRSPRRRGPAEGGRGPAMLRRWPAAPGNAGRAPAAVTLTGGSGAAPAGSVLPGQRAAGLGDGAARAPSPSLCGFYPWHAKQRLASLVFLLTAHRNPFPWLCCCPSHLPGHAAASLGSCTLFSWHLA